MTNLTLLLDYDPPPIGPLDYWWDDDATATQATTTARQSFTWASDGSVTDETGADVTADPPEIVDLASDDPAYTNTPRRLWLAERFTNVRRNPAPFALQLLTANGSPQRLGDLRLAAIGAAAPEVVTTYLTRAEWLAANGFAHGDGTTITQDPDTGALSATAPDLSGYATTAALATEAGTRATDDASLAAAITSEATTRASADSTHAALTTTAHGGLVASTDSRLTDARTPTGAAGGDLTGTYPNPTLGTSGVTPGSYTNLNATIDAKGRVTAASNGTGGGGSGTVTSVDLTMPSDFTVSGNPVTGAGTLAVTANTQAANLVKAGPGSGAAAAPTYRALVAADLPATAVTPGTYIAATVTFDAAGRATAVNANTILSASADNLFTQQQTITKSNGNSTTGVGTVAVFAGTANVNPAANSGTKFQCKLKSNPTDGRLLAEVRWVWVTPTDASRVAKFVIATNTAGSDTQADRLQLSAAGADLLTSPLTFGTSSTPPAPAAGSVTIWFDGTNWKWIKSDGSTGTIF